MATYTTYLNLEKPTTSETFNLLKMNQNWDKIDAGVSALNSKSSNVLQVSNISANVSNVSATYEKVGKVALIHVSATCNQQIPVGSNISCNITGLHIYGNSHGSGYAGDTAGVLALSKAGDDSISALIRIVGSPLISGYTISCTAPIVVNE